MLWNRIRFYFVYQIIFPLVLYHKAPSLALEYTPPGKSENANETSILEGIDIAFEPYKTWGHGIEVADLLLVAYPKSEDEIARVVNWANQVGRKVRPRGYKHSFPPLTITKDTDPSKVVLLDLTKYLTKMEMVTIPAEQTVHNENLRAVKIETGASWQDFMAFCEQNNVSLVHSIIIGDASVGGVLAIGAHGAAVPAKGEDHKPGFSYGSLSNLIAAFKAIVWDPEKNAYSSKSFSRSDSDSRAFLSHVGRALLTEVTILVGENYNLRCKSITDIPADELFANPETNPNATRTFTSFLDSTGRADVQWYQFTKNPWLKVWSVEKEKPSQCFSVDGPYNYQFPVNVNVPSLTVPELGEVAYKNLLSGLTRTNASDIWGPSKNILLYSNGSSQSIVYGGFVILTNREKLQTVLSRVFEFYRDLNEEYAKKTEYPIDYYIKFRVTGLDNANETLLKDAKETMISPISPSPEHPQFDVALWMNTFTKRENALGNQFMKRFESFYFDTFTGKDGLARPEWSKSWGYTDEGPFVNETMLNEIIPKRYGANWKLATEILDKYDPARLYSNSFLDGLFSQ